ncbi:MAG: lipopolysaccharide heptosyltransferase II [Acidobacteria bacterium]|nr:lipopolysaccharide heptosyltransferase II [Acidobacteriota bacterium]MBS1867326.1 lipopolysaccharide heptosyltransferase II [Acidobacteriota bacterium]
MKILIRATNWVGDAIMALPALQAVRSKFSEAEIGVVARPYVLDIYREQGIANEFIAYDSASEHQGFSGRERLATQLREKKYDVALLLQNAFDAAWLAWRAGIPERIGYARDGRSLLLTKAIPVPKAGEIPAHEKFYYLELLRRVGWVESIPNVDWIELKVSREKSERAEAFLTAAGARQGMTRIAVGAGASYGSAKCWPPERFAAVLNKLAEERDAETILFGTPGEAAVSDAIIAGVKKKPVNLTGKTSIADLPAMLSRCNLFIGNDSGAMHVAGAAGLPIVAIFGPTDPQGTMPVTPKCTVVQEKSYCSPCFLRRCPTDHRCMKAVTAEMVISAARIRLSAVSPT